MKYLLLPLLVGTLTFSACDSKPVQDEKAANKEEAKALDKQAEVVKDEGKAEAKKDEAAADRKAEDLKKAADAKKDEKPAQ